jgi:hypothetical protein
MKPNSIVLRRNAHRLLRFPDAVQRLFGAAPQSRDPQSFRDLDLMDPGSAAHHAATTAALRCIRGTQAARVKKRPASSGPLNLSARSVDRDQAVLV